MYRYEKKETADDGPAEVVLCYDPAAEVVETYSRQEPLPDYPSRPRPAETAKKRRRKTGVRVFAGLMILVLAAAVGGWIYCREHTEDGGGSEFTVPWESQSTSETVCTIPLYDGDETAEMTFHASSGKPLSATEIYQKVNPAVVTVMGTIPGGSSIGTGVIFTENGFVLTNAHVIEDCSDCTVVLASGDYYDAALVAYDSGEDLAVLKIEGGGFPAVSFGDSDALAVGETVYAIGNPLGVDLRGSFTSGMVSGLSREIEVNGAVMTLLQTDAALNNGNSGGPLINVYGQVIGINTAKMQSAYSNVEGIGFAIPTAAAARKVNQLIVYGEVLPTPVIGITVGPLTDDTEDGHRGLIVYSVEPGSGGDLAGIREGDIVVSADGEPLTTNSDLLAVRDRHLVGESVELEICRDGEHFTAEVTLQAG